MKLLHTSDWHIGRQTYGLSRRPDHEAVLDEVVELAKSLRPHLILHSGDVFETSRPSVEDLKLAQDCFLRLSELAPTVVIAGNHDSPALFDLFSELLGPRSKLRFIGAVRSPAQGGILEFPGDGREVIRLATLPFVHANRVVDALEQGPELRTMTYADRLQRMQLAFGQVLEKGYHPERHLLLLTAHLFVDGALWSHSERPLHVGETYATRVAAVPHVSYAAFGHIHRPQPLPGAPGRYAGSPIQLDYGEEGEVKETVFVEASPGRAARVEPIAMRSGRPLLTLKGSMEELQRRAPEVAAALLRVTVDTPEPTQGLTEWVARLFPQATLAQVSECCAASRVVAVDEVAAREPGDLLQAFTSYLAETGDGEGAALQSLFGRALESLRSGEELPLPQELGDLLKVLA